MAKRDQTNRWRCCIKGCNPKLIGEEVAANHKSETGHRVAKWPVRSEEGKRKAVARNKSGYYNKYNVGSKSAIARGLVDISGIDMFGDIEEDPKFSARLRALKRREEREKEYFEEYGMTEEDEFYDAEYDEYRRQMEF